MFADAFRCQLHVRPMGSSSHGRMPHRGEDGFGGVLASVAALHIQRSDVQHERVDLVCRCSRRDSDRTAASSECWRGSSVLGCCRSKRERVFISHTGHLRSSSERQGCNREHHRHAAFAWPPATGTLRSKRSPPPYMALITTMYSSDYLKLVRQDAYC